jgi:hypothetical protein
MKKLSALASIALLLLLLGAQNGLAQIQLHLAPQDTTIGPGETLPLTLRLDEVQDVRSFEAWFRFDSQVLSFSDGQPGAAFSATGCPLFAGADVDSSGLLHVYAVILGADCWATGPGQLFTLEFSAVGLGTSSLEVEDVALFAPQSGELENVVLAPVSVTVSDAQSHVPLAGGEGYFLEACYPNPFNPQTRIRFAIPEPANVWLGVFSLDGKLVSVLQEGDLPSGAHSVFWDGRDQRGRSVSSGKYLYLMQAGDFIQRRSMVLLK